MSSVLASAGLLALVWPRWPWGEGWIHTGGRLGDVLALNLAYWFHSLGAALVLAVVFLAGFLGATRLSYAALLEWAGQALTGLWGVIRRRRVEAPPPRVKVGREEPVPTLISEPAALPDEVVPIVQAPAAPTAAPEPARRPRRAAAAGKFALPPLDLLDPGQPWDQQVHEGQMVAQAAKLEDTLRHFGVEGRVTAIIPGPVVSRFELEPAPGVKISKVTGLADDLALALKALSIRIVAPVPGKAVIGIEVPNPKRQVVALRDILADGAYQKYASRLTMALGKDIMGTPVVSDLARMPHLLIAGATGTGKSVGLNAMIISILCKATPEEVPALVLMGITDPAE